MCDHAGNRSTCNHFLWLPEWSCCPCTVHNVAMTCSLGLSDLSGPTASSCQECRRQRNRHVYIQLFQERHNPPEVSPYNLPDSSVSVVCTSSVQTHPLQGSAFGVSPLRQRPPRQAPYFGMGFAFLQSLCNFEVASRVMTCLKMPGQVQPLKARAIPACHDDVFSWVQTCAAEMSQDTQILDGLQHCGGKNVNNNDNVPYACCNPCIQ